MRVKRIDFEGPSTMSNENEKTKRERLFFHDLINQTHGLILFLNQRQNQQTGIDAVEIPMLEQEVRTLQSLIKDHFLFQHKNIHSDYEVVPFSVAESALMVLIQTYLTSSEVKTFIRLKGEKRESAVVYFPIFYRIMNNLIKNMAEAHAEEAHFSFEFTSSGLVIETQNSIGEKVDQKSRNGAGLESIEFLALEIGGSAHFEKSADTWTNRIYLPANSGVQEIKKAA